MMMMKRSLSEYKSQRNRWRAGQKNLTALEAHLGSSSPNMLTVLVLVTLLMVSVESDSSSTEEWKSLSNPKSRTLFFQILQSYLDGREGQAEGLSRKMNMDRNSKLTNTAFDKYSNFLHNRIFDD